MRFRTCQENALKGARLIGTFYIVLAILEFREILKLKTQRSQVIVFKKILKPYKTEGHPD